MNKKKIMDEIMKKDKIIYEIIRLFENYKLTDKNRVEILLSIAKSYKELMKKNDLSEDKR